MERISATQDAMEFVTSADGTAIAYDRWGSGPAVILVDGALCRRAFGPMGALSALLAQRFSVYTYDRRGRGDSRDTEPYAPEREIEDLAALIQAAGGKASLFGASSGGALALAAAAAGLPVHRLAVYEPPYVSEGAARAVEPDHLAALRQRLTQGQRGAAVRYFMRDMANAPAAVVLMMQCLLPVWSKLKAVAHTLPYDATIMGDWRVPTARAASVRVPTLVMHGEKTEARLSQAAQVLASAVPGAELISLPGQNHNAQAKVLAPVLAAFLTRDGRAQL